MMSLKSGDKAQFWENMQMEKDLVELEEIVTDRERSLSKKK